MGRAAGRRRRAAPHAQARRRAAPGPARPGPRDRRLPWWRRRLLLRARRARTRPRRQAGDADHLVRLGANALQLGFRARAARRQRLARGAPLRLWPQRERLARHHEPGQPRAREPLRRGAGVRWLPPSGPGLVVSPHLDDAVFGCGVWLASRPGSVVATVFAGVPDDPSRATDWDRRCGFTSAGEAVAVRLDEDRRALARLGAEPRWLAFADSQYGQEPTRADVAQALRALLERENPRWLLLPLGLFHSDHRLVHEAAVDAFAGRGDGLDLVFWEDALYRGMPGVLQARLAELLAAGQVGTPLFDAPPNSATLAAKRKAVSAYASQLRAFGQHGVDDVDRPERYWRFAPPEQQP
ncbi:hypothetical protein CLD22_13730 [Rubrivivax gelatinosus]|nr:hypothetical protein [Rubrivivax gelatinosus]